MEYEPEELREDALSRRTAVELQDKSLEVVPQGGHLPLLTCNQVRLCGPSLG